MKVFKVYYFKMLKNHIFIKIEYEKINFHWKKLDFQANFYV